MEKETEFNQRTDNDQQPQKQFRIEIANGEKGRNFDIRPLGSGRFEIFDLDGSIGTIQLDEQDHARCESQGCELDLPLLHLIREQIQFHQKLNTQ